MENGLHGTGGMSGLSGKGGTGGTASLEPLLAALADIGRAPGGGYARFAWTPTELTLREWFVSEAVRRGLEVVEDRVGNLWAWWGDPDADGPGVVTGSHLDSVPGGGAYDGPLGVASAFAAVDALRAERGDGPLPRPLAVVAFADEEGARFGVACAGSRGLTGVLSPERGLALRDDDGTTLAEALRAAGRAPELWGPDPEVLARVGVFVELHVEQGRLLSDHEERTGQRAAVGVGEGIWPHGRWRVDLAGRADHAGTTPLDHRQDPMLDLAHLVLATREAATGAGALATVGKVVVEPNGVNAIPSLVRAWVDARAPQEAQVRAVLADLARFAPQEESWTPPTVFDAALAGRLAGLLDAPVVGTGAGHDAGILAAAGVSTAMLFVRNPTGVSHSPEEHAEPEDRAAGVAALTRVLSDLVGR